MKILIVRLGGFAEILLTTPLIRCLHHTAPAAELHVLTDEAFAPLLQHHPFLQKHYTMEEDEALFSLLKEEGFDRLIDLQNNVFSLRLAKQLGCKAVRLPQNRKSLLAWLGMGQEPKEAAQFVQDCFATVAPLGIYNDGSGLEYVIPESDTVPAHDIPHSHQAGFLCIAIEAADAQSQPPVQLFQALCRQINHPLVLIGGRENIVPGEIIASVDPIKIYNACGKFSFAETADLIRQSRLLVAGPSPWVQVGAALQKEMVVVHNGQPSLQTTPYYGQRFLQHKPQVCDRVQLPKHWFRPGVAAGNKSFPLPSFRHSRQTGLTEVMQKINGKLSAR